jgi:hypothetical protein
VRKVFGYLDAAGKVIAGISALVVLVATVAGLIFLLWPSAKPSPPPSTVSGKITNIGSYGLPTYRTYLTLIGRRVPRDQKSRSLDVGGRYYELTLSLRGLHKQHAMLKWSLHDAHDDSPVAAPPNWINQPAGAITSPADATQQVAKVWIPQPSFAGRFYVLIELDVGSTSLDARATEPFDGAAAAPTPTTRPGAEFVRTVLLGARTKSSHCSVGPKPDRACSPGAYDTGLTVAAICAPGFSRALQSLVHMPDAERQEVALAYGIPGLGGLSHEFDRIVPLALGGSNDIANVFPQRATPPGYHEKDRLEAHLHQEVCGGALTLAAAQRAIATDWIAAYRAMRY